MLMDGRSVSPAGAAMAGGFTVDSIDAHDGTTPNKGHAGSAVFPALLAVADAQRSLGARHHGCGFRCLARDLPMRSVIARVRSNMRPVPTITRPVRGPAVGVAAATARILDASPEQIRHAVGIAEYHGPRSQMMRCIDFPTMVRDGCRMGGAFGRNGSLSGKRRLHRRPCPHLRE